jgi:hypothetical protein
MEDPVHMDYSINLRNRKMAGIQKNYVQRIMLIEFQNGKYGKITIC